MELIKPSEMLLDPTFVRTYSGFGNDKWIASAELVICVDQVFSEFIRVKSMIIVTLIRSKLRSIYIEFLLAQSLLVLIQVDFVSSLCCANFDVYWFLANEAMLQAMERFYVVLH